MIRVISSPSSSTTGLATLILPMLSAFFLGESELQRALGKAARLINRPSRLRAVRGGNDRAAFSHVRVVVDPWKNGHDQYSTTGKAARRESGCTSEAIME